MVEKEESMTQLQKRAVKQYISQRLSTAQVKSTKSVDIIAHSGGETWYYKIKATKESKTYFGAVPLSAWKCALNHIDHFLFVIAVLNSDTDKFDFMEIKPEDLVLYSSVPPFKIDFTIDLTAKNHGIKKGRNKAYITRLNYIRQLVNIYEKQLNKQMPDL